MLKKATLGYKLIKEDTDFSLEGMVEPTFYNFGLETVYILHSPVEPGQSYAAGVSGYVMSGSIPISFEGTNKKGRRLICNYGAPVSNC